MTSWARFISCICSQQMLNSTMCYLQPKQNFLFFNAKKNSNKIITDIYPSLKNEIMFQKWYVYDNCVAFHLKGNVMTNMLVVHNYMYMCEHSFFLPYISYPNFTRRFMNVHTLDKKNELFWIRILARTRLSILSSLLHTWVITPLVSPLPSFFGK